MVIEADFHELLFSSFPWPGAITSVSLTYEPPHDKTSKMACVPSEDSDQPGHLPSLIRVFAVHSVGS